LTTTLAANNTSQLGSIGGGASSLGIDGRNSQAILTEGLFSVGSATPQQSLTNDVLGFAIDFTTKNVFVSQNNDFTYFGAGCNPVTEANPSFTFTGTPTFFPACGIYAADANNHVLYATNTFNYSPPTGYVGWGT
jgi:hypothetical protein